MSRVVKPYGAEPFSSKRYAEERFGHASRIPTVADPTALGGLVISLSAKINGSITVANGAVASWVDQSTAGNDFTQGVAGDKPAHNDAGDKITFNDDFLEGGDIPSLEGQAYTLYMVLKRNGIDDTQFIYSQQADISTLIDSSAGGWFIRYRSDNKLSVLSRNAADDGFLITVEDDAYVDVINRHVVTVRINSSKVYLYRNETLLKVGRTEGLNYKNVRKTTIGAASQSQGGYNAGQYRGDLDYLLLFNRTHSHSLATGIITAIKSDWSIS